jgi:carbon storage regulator
MLVLSRKLGERIVVPDCELVVTVLAVDGNRVRLGISAPPEVAVHREEVWRQMGQPTHSPPLKG